MSSQKSIKRITPPKIRSHKGKTPLVCLTAYDTRMAELIDPYCDLILVGDSVGMVVHGLPDTLSVTLEMMILHGQAVLRGSRKSLIAVDMPFGSYEASKEQAFLSAVRIVKETGCQAVKVEGGISIAETIQFLSERGVAVIGHVGLRPQTVRSMGGYKIQGRSRQAAEQILSDAKAVAEAGAFALVIEGVEETLAQEITHAVHIPTIGIGASRMCDGQILVSPDMLGLTYQTPKFVKEYGNMKGFVLEAVKTYADEVRKREFPMEENTYQDKNE